MIDKSNLKSAIWTGHKFELRPTRIYDKKQSTIVKVRKAGFCGTDHHVIENPLLSSNLSLGHEIVGEVVSLGTNILSAENQKINVGDRVIVIPGLPCGACLTCLSYGGHENLCEHRKVHGFGQYSPHHYFPQGGFSTYIELLDGLWVYKVPDTIPDEIAVLAEPLAIAVKSVERALCGNRPDKDFGPGVALRAAVIGLGPIGCTVAYVLKSLSADIIGIDIDPWKINTAKDNMKIDTLQLPGNPLEADELFKKQHRDDIDVVFECTGTTKAFELSLLLARKGGKVVEMGNCMLGNKATIDPSTICRKELNIVGSVLASPFTYRKVFNLLGKTDTRGLANLTTHVVNLDNINWIKNILHEKRFLKIVVDMGAN